MAIQIRKAERRKAKLRLALMGPTGSGKTMSALRLAFGIGGKVGIIDTENGSADLYADAGEYDVITLEKPYSVANYREAIAAFEDAGYDVIIIDSLSHAWAGSGGLLDRQGQAEKKTGNSFTAWREITPEHNALVEAMLTSPSHIIATMRVKTEYVMEKDQRGKTVPRKIGLQPVQRDGLEYEFTVVMDVDAEHRASASKDRTRLFDGWNDTITERTGKSLLEWLESGAEAPPRKTADDALLERIEKALAEASDAAMVARIKNHHEAQHLKDRLRNGKMARLNAAIDAAVARTAPPPEPEQPATEQPAVENYDWPDATDSKEAA